MTPMTAPLHADIAALLPRLRRYARVLCDNRDEADDLLQAALARALGGAVAWQAGGRLDLWMLRIVTGAWQAQARGREPAQGNAEAAPCGPALPRALARLDGEERLAIGLVLVEGLPYALAAQVLEMPTAQLVATLLRARAALQTQLAEAARRAP